MNKSIIFYGNIYENYFDVVMGGGEKQISLIIKELSKNYKITIIDSKIKFDKIVKNVQFISLRKKINNVYLFKIFYFFLLQNELFKRKADIIYGRIRGYLHLATILPSFFNKSKVVYHCAHDLDLSSVYKRIKLYYLKKSFNLNLVLSFFLTEIFFNVYIMFVDVLIIQHIGQKTKRFKNKDYFVIPNLFESVNYKNSLIKIPYKNYLIYVGSISERKGANELYKIINGCKETNFILVGKFHNSFLKNNFTALGNVTITNHLELNLVLKLISKSDALISTSEAEGFPNVFIESWYLGKPVISLHVDPSDIIKSNNLGYFANSDIKKMINHIKTKNYNKIDSKNISNFFANNFKETKIKSTIKKILNNEKH